MNRLISVIGKAPSELEFPALLDKLRSERDRVRLALENFRNAPPKKTSKKKPSVAAKAKQARSLLGNMSVEDFLEKVKLLEETQKEKNEH